MSSITPYASGSNAIAPLPLYTPDFGTISTLLQRRATMYEQGFAQVKSANDSIVNAPLTNQENEVLRSQYLQDAQKKLKDISSMDLSDMRNVDNAQSVFAPFWQDKFMLKDMALTRQAQSEISKAYAARDSTDEKIRSTYSDKSVQYIMNGLDPLRTASRTDADFSKVQQRRFVRSQNIMGDIEKLRKESGFEVITTDASGPQIVTTTNGVKSVTSYKNFVQANWKPEYDDYINMEMTVAHENTVKEKMRQYNITEDEAKVMIGKDYLADTKKTYNKDLTELDANILSIDSQMEAYKKMPVSDAVMQKYQELEGLKKQHIANKDNIVESIKNLDSNYNNVLQGVAKNGPVYFTDYGKRKKMNDIANALASATKVDVKKNDAFWADPELKLNLAKFDLEKDKFQFTKDIALGKYPFSGTGKAIVGADGSVTFSGTGGGEETLNGQETTATGKGKTPFDTPMVSGVNVNAQSVAKSGYEVYLTTMGKQRYQAYNDIVTAIELDPELSSLLPTDFIKGLRAADGVSTPVGKTEYKDKIFNDLKEKGIIPKDANYDYATGPTRTVNAIVSHMFDKYHTKYTSGTATDNELAIYNKLEEAKNSISNWGLQNKEHEELVNKALMNDKYASIRTGNSGNYRLLDPISLAGIASKKYGISSQDIATKDLMAMLYSGDGIIKTEAPRSDRAGNYYAPKQYVLSESTGKKYNVSGYLSKFEDDYKFTKMGALYKEVEAEVLPNAKYYIDRQGKSGMVINYTSDAKRDTLDKGQVLVTELLTGNNFDQANGTGGVANIEDLVARGGDREKIITFFNSARGDIGNNLANVSYLTIGKNGNPSALIKFKQDILKEEGKSGSGVLDEASIAAIGAAGIEVNQADGVRLKNAPTVNEAGYISKMLTQGEIIRNTKADEEVGFRYTMKMNSTGNEIILKVDKRQLKQAIGPDGKPVITGENDFVEGTMQPISVSQMSPEEIYQKIQEEKLKVYRDLREYRKSVNNPTNAPVVTLGDYLKSK